MNKEITVKFRDILANVRINTSYRHAPACSNPDSPAFSDPGDDCEFDIINAWQIKSNHDLGREEIEELYDSDAFYSAVVEANIEYEESKAENAYYEMEDM